MSERKIAVFFTKLKKKVLTQRILISFLSVAFVILFIRYLVILVIPDASIDGLMSGLKGILAIQPDETFEFDPGGWIGLLAMILGTLMIVISIASQSTPKLIDLYVNDWISLFYIWFITLTFIHNLFTKVAPDTGLNSNVNNLLNTFLFVPVATLCAVPYVYYILKYSKASNVIEKINKQNFRLIKDLRKTSTNRLFDSGIYAADYQFQLFELINQLADLFKYSVFKEPKAMIIQRVGGAAVQYVYYKPCLNGRFFKVSGKITNDSAFLTLAGQIREIENSRTVYEQKVFRFFGEAYNDCLRKDEFDLASLCAGEITNIGTAAIQAHDDALLHSTFIRFNTFLRFSIKHGLKESEVRNVYNVIFHYARLIQQLIQAGQHDHILLCCGYIKSYAAEIVAHTRKEGSFVFLLDVFASEMKSLLIHLFINDYEDEFQRKVLAIMLEMDDTKRVQSDEKIIVTAINEGVRVIQVNLACFYVRHDKQEFIDMIIEDILNDYKGISRTTFNKTMDRVITRTRSATSKFWEDTDRGNTNIYYSRDQKYLDAFLDRLTQKADSCF